MLPQVEKEALGAPASRQAAPPSKPMRSAGSFEGSWGWDDSPAQQQQQQQGVLLRYLAALRPCLLTPCPAVAARPSLRATHSAAELGGGGSGGNYSIEQLNASAAGKDQFFARKMQENASRRARCGAVAPFPSR